MRGAEFYPVRIQFRADTTAALSSPHLTMRSFLLATLLPAVVLASTGFPIEHRSRSANLSPEDRLALKIKAHHIVKGKYGLPQDLDVMDRLAKRGAIGTEDLAGNDL